VKRYLAYELALREREAERYDEHRPQYQRIQEWKILRSHLRPKPTDLVLDAGCGTGIFSLDLQEAGCNVIGLDLSGVFVQITRKRCDPSRVKVLVGNILELPFEMNQFDLILCSGVLGQLIEEEDFRKSLEELGRVVRPGGRLVITTYNYHIIDRVRRSKVRACLNRGINYVKYSRKELLHLAKESLGDGFQVEAFGILNLRRPPAIWLWNALPMLRKHLLRWDVNLERHTLSRLFAYLTLLHIERRA
jgi:SAM-dependent methyltransferase